MQSLAKFRTPNSNKTMGIELECFFDRIYSHVDDFVMAFPSPWTTDVVDSLGISSEAVGKLDHLAHCSSY